MDGELGQQGFYGEPGDLGKQGKRGETYWSVSVCMSACVRVCVYAPLMMNCVVLLEDRS